LKTLIKVTNEVIANCGFDSDDISSVCVTFDKYEKIGIEGISLELLSKNFSQNCINNFLDFLSSFPITLLELKNYCKNTQVINDLEKIIDVCSKISNSEYEVEFDLSLVRGQGYYTGTVFEIKSKDFNSSIGGGGRYDGLIGKFIGEDIPAVGFSIGFERIYCILSEINFVVPNTRKKIAVIYNSVNFSNAIKIAEQYRIKYDVSLFEETKKLGKFISAIANNGYYGIINCAKTSSLEVFTISE